MTFGNSNGAQERRRRGRTPSPETLKYAEYLGTLHEGEAGKLTLGPGESLSTVRRQLSAAGKALGKRVATRHEGDSLYFWVSGPLPDLFTAPAPAVQPGDANGREAPDTPDAAADAVITEEADPPTPSPREPSERREPAAPTAASTLAPARARPTYIAEVPRLPAPPQQLRFRRGR